MASMFHDSTPVLAFFGNLSFPEMAIVGMIALLLFGKRLPTVARSLGQSLTEFKKGMNGIENEFRSAVSSTPTTSRRFRFSA